MAANSVSCFSRCRVHVGAISLAFDKRSALISLMVRACVAGSERKEHCDNKILGTSTHLLKGQSAVVVGYWLMTDCAVKVQAMEHLSRLMTVAGKAFER